MEKKTTDKIIKLLREKFEIEIPGNEKPRRLYHGVHQKSIGAWSWAIGGNKNMQQSYGSQWNMRQVLDFKTPTLFLELGGDISIIPD